MTDHAYKLRQSRLGRKPFNEAVITTLYILAFLLAYGIQGRIEYEEQVARYSYQYGSE